MIGLMPILLAIAIALVMHQVGAWRAARHLDATSRPWTIRG